MKIRPLLTALAFIAGIAPAMAQGTSIQRFCGKSAFVNAAATGTTQIAPNPNQAPFTVPPTVPGIAPGTPIFVCGYVILVPASTAAGLTYGVPASLPGTGCGTSPVAITPTYTGAVALADNGGGFVGLSVPAGNNLCVTVTGTGPAQVLVYYDNNPL
jgi:hypothetical protein